MFESLWQAAGSLLRGIRGGAKRQRGRHFHPVERYLALHDHDLLRQHQSQLNRNQLHWLDWAGHTLANPQAADADVGDALDILRQVSRLLAVPGLLIVPLRLDEPAYQAASTLPHINPAGEPLTSSPWPG